MYRIYISHPSKVWRNTRQLFSPIMGDLPGSALGGRHGGALEACRWGSGAPAMGEEGRWRREQRKARVSGLGLELKLVIPCRIIGLV